MGMVSIHRVPFVHRVLVFGYMFPSLRVIHVLIKAGIPIRYLLNSGCGISNSDLEEVNM